MIRVILVDDHVLVRSGMRALLDAQPDLEVTGVAGDGAEGVELTLASDPDVVLHVLEGEVEVIADRERHRLTRGQTRTLDRGVPRKLSAIERSRVLVLLAPAGLEELLAVAADPATEPDDRAALLAVGGVQAVPAA